MVDKSQPFRLIVSFYGRPIFSTHIAVGRRDFDKEARAIRRGQAAEIVLRKSNLRSPDPGTIGFRENDEEEHPS